MTDASQPTWYRRIWQSPGFQGMMIGIGIGLAVLVGIAGLSFAGNRLAEQRRNSYQVEMGAACQEVPAVVDGRAVRHYAGTVVGRPSDAGYWGDNDGPNRLLGAVVFVRTEGRERPLAVRRYREDRPLVGARLHFCAVTDEAGFWWPLVGYEAGMFGGRLYGEPSGPFETVKWIRDLPAAGRSDTGG